MELIKKSDITVEFKCTYEGKDYDIFINRENVPEEYAPWYGVLYLAGLPAIGSKDAGIHGEYIVVKDDTLNMIAAMLNTTVDELLRLNPDITNRNLIYPGQIIKY